MPKTAWRTFVEVIQPFRWAFLFFCVLILVGNGLAYSVPYFLKQIADVALVTDSSLFTFGLVSAPLLSIMGILLFQEMSFRSAHYMEVVILYKVRQALDIKIFDALLEQSPAYYEDKLSGKISKRAQQIAKSTEYFIANTPWEFGWALSAFISSIILLFIAHPYLAGIFVAWSIVYILTSIPLLKVMYKKSLLAAEKDAVYGGQYVDTVANINIVFSFGARKNEKQTFLQAMMGYIDAVRQEEMWMVWNKLQQGTSVISLAFILIVSSVYAYSRNLITVTDFILIASIIPSMTAIVWTIGDTCLNTFRKVSDMVDALRDLNRSITVLPEGSKELKVIQPVVTFTSLSFAYPARDESVIRDLNLKIGAGERVGVVGSSGAGKSTLVKLLLRHYDAESGSITIDGQNITDVTLESLRQNVAFVPQDTTLFHRSLLENIQYAKPEASMDEVIAVSKKAHAHNFIESLPQQYDTLVGERGVKLSGGQRQRIAIARAMLKDAPILVLDEATSALDGESEEVVQAGFKELFAGRTVIAIAHRLSTLREMDRIVVIEAGQIVEDGTPQELLAQTDSVFAQKWEQQKGGFVN